MQLVLKTVVSYRSVPRIITLFTDLTPPNITWTPHFTSVINWTLRLGLGLLKQVKPIKQPWLAIIDHSIDIGTKKVFVVLRVTMDALLQRKGAIQLDDCECIGLTVREIVNGETTAEDLNTIFKKSGMPHAIIKDCDSSLRKGVRLCSQENQTDLPAIDDIGHVMASALKHQFEGKAKYKQFIAMTNQGANCLRQTNLAFLIPPKLRSKGRFQSIGKLGKWTNKMLPLFSVNGRARKDSVLARLRKALPGFSKHKSFIKEFAYTAKIISHVMAILKNSGLDQASYEQCCQLANELPKRSKVKKRLLQWLQKHIVIQRKISSQPLLVSSDIIESLFGNFKHIMERSPQADMNRTTLLIPALCGSRNETTGTQALDFASQKDLCNWERKEIPYTLRKKRLCFYNSVEV